VLRQWLAERWPSAARRGRSTTARACRAIAHQRQLLARVLQAAWCGPVMPELMSSLPVSGLDGTLRARARRSAART
jgi:D-alanyl-D-alanine carboxypeptidase/D-alanyl-D-alanine-endopeptidase (penicillin-binding protein 4)